MNNAKTTSRKQETETNATSLEELLVPTFRTFIRQVNQGQGEGVYEKVLAIVEKPLIQEALNATEQNQLQAARLLGIHRNTLGRKMKKLGLK